MKTVYPELDGSSLKIEDVDCDNCSNRIKACYNCKHSYALRYSSGIICDLKDNYIPISEGPVKWVTNIESMKKIEKMTQNPDNVNHPAHYNVGRFEVIDIIEDFTKGLYGICATDTGNIIKYILRWHRKNGLEDLKKAQWYLNHLINHIEKETKN